MDNGDDGDRTHNPRLAKAVLSQLSYVPDLRGWVPGRKFPGLGPRPELSGAGSPD